MKKRRIKRVNPARKRARFLFYLNALAWLGFGIYVVHDMISNANGYTIFLVGFFMLGNAILMFLCGFRFERREKWLYYFAIIFLLLNILLAILDRFRLFDTITAIIDLVILLSLYSLRKEYFPKS